MTPDDVRTAAEQLVDFHERFASLFGKEQAQDHAYDYLKGLMVCPERKSIEPIALLVGHGDVSGLQQFVGAAPWAYDDVMAEAQALFADELVPFAADSPIGMVGVVDESAFTKKGTHSAGVARQHNGRLGDEEYGRAGHFLDELEGQEQRYVVEVPVTTAVWTADPARCIPAYSGRGRVPTAPTRDAVRTVAALAAELSASAWQTLQVGEGALGPLVFEFAAVRIWSMRHRKPGPPAWLLIRRSLGEKPELKYYISNAGEATPLSTLVLVACTRCQVEEFLEDCKSYLGMTQYETRSYVGWHHHMTLVGLAHLFVMLARKRLQKNLGWQNFLDQSVFKFLEVCGRVATEPPALRPHRLTSLQSAA
jgi:SRSO17 transposase